ncbi:hypothetical protein RYX36_006695 [Vicia faba]
MGGRFSQVAPASGDIEMQQNPGGRGGGGGGAGGPGDDDELANNVARRLYLVIGVSGVITIIVYFLMDRDSHPPLAPAQPPMLPPMLPPMPLPKP